MKRIKLKINRGLKRALIVSSILATIAVSSANAKAAGVKLMGTSLALVSVAAKLKKAKKWDDLDEGTQQFIELQDEQAKELNGELEAIKEAKEQLEADAKEAKEAAEKGNKTIEELQESVKKHAALFDQLKNRVEGVDKTGAIAKALKENEAKIKAFLEGGNKSGKLEIEVKAAQTAADIQTHTIGDYAPGIGQIPVRQAAIEPLFPVVNTSKEFIKYMDQESVVRDAKNVAGCAASNHNTKLEWKERNIQITKVRDFLDICQDMMDDYDFVEGEVRNLIDSSVTLKVDAGLLTDDGVYPNLHSVDEAASEFDAANTLGNTIDPWAGSVQEPNMFDLVVAMASQIIALGQDNSYMPNVVLWNTIDKYKNMLVKDKNNQYLLPPFVVKVGNTEYTIDNMRVVTSPIVPANSCYVFDSTKATLYNRRGITIELSYENNDNFETETVTMKAYRRMNLLIRNVNKNAFMKCSDVAAALVALKKAE
ncbi:phage major capsid protein [Candidatus Dependentiae bacterium]|nr:phage major capsid protein [Candidatus Dependentiae bacterium]